MQTKLYNGIVSVFPSDAHQEILSALTGVRHNAGILGIVSIVGLLWSGTSLFASMEFALTMIFGTHQRDTLRQRLMGLVMVLVFIAAVLLVGHRQQRGGDLARRRRHRGDHRRGRPCRPRDGHLPMGAQSHLRSPRPLAGRTARRCAHRALLAPLPAVREGVQGLRDVRTAVRALLPAGDVAVVHVPVHPHRRGVQQDAPRNPDGRGDRRRRAADSRGTRTPPRRSTRRSARRRGRESLPSQRPCTRGPVPPAQTHALLVIGVLAAAVGAAVSRTRRQANRPPALR